MLKNLENVQEYSRFLMCFKNLKIIPPFCKSSNTHKEKEIKFSSVLLDTVYSVVLFQIIYEHILFLSFLREFGIKNSMIC